MKLLKTKNGNIKQELREFFFFFFLFFFFFPLFPQFCPLHPYSFLSFFFIFFLIFLDLVLFPQILLCWWKVYAYTLHFASWHYHMIYWSPLQIYQNEKVSYGRFIVIFGSFWVNRKFIRWIMLYNALASWSLWPLICLMPFRTKIPMPLSGSCLRELGVEYKQP